MLRFQNSEILWFLVSLIVLAILFLGAQQQRKKKLKKIGTEQVVLQQISNFSLQKHILKAILLFSAVLMAIIGIANLQKTIGTQQIERKGIDVIIALDVSKSMLAKDMLPNRLEKAKLFISKLIGKINNNRIGLIVFAGNAYVSTPLTVDIAAVKMNLESITPNAIPTQGTVLGEAIRMARESFNSKDTKYKSIVLISDGEDHDNEVLKEVKKSVEEGITINVVGVGSENGSPIFDEETQENKKDENGNEVISKLNIEALQQIAQQGQGSFSLLNSIENSVNEMTTEINSLPQKSFSSNAFTEYKSYFQYFILVAFILLIAEFLISERKKKTHF